MLAASVTSSETASTASPSRAIARAAASPFAGSRAARSTRIPLSESWRQTSKPMPRLAPVTRAIGDDGRMARASAADRLNRDAGVGGRFADRTPALEFGGEGGLFLFPGADRIRAEHEAQRRIVAFDRGDHGLRRPGGIAGLLAATLLCAPVVPGAGEGIRPGSLCPEAESGPVHSDGVAEADAPKNQSSHHRHRYRSDWMSAAPMSYNTRRPNARALAARCANRGEADGAQGRLDTATRMADADFSSGGNSGETSSPNAHTPSLGPLDELNPAGSSCRNSASSRSIANCNAVLFASLRSPRPSPS